MISAIISFVLGKVHVWTPILAIILAAFSIHRAGGFGNRALVVDRFFAWWMLLVAGGIFNGFIMHTFFPGFTAHLIGWAESPFQREVAYADAAVAVMGVMAFFIRDKMFRLGAVVVFAICIGGDGIGHLIEISGGDMAEYNTGSLLLADLFSPLIASVLLFFQFRLGVPPKG